MEWQCWLDGLRRHYTHRLAAAIFMCMCWLVAGRQGTLSRKTLNDECRIVILSWHRRWLLRQKQHVRCMTESSRREPRNPIQSAISPIRTVSTSQKLRRGVVFRPVLLAKIAMVQSNTGALLFIMLYSKNSAQFNESAAFCNFSLALYSGPARCLPLKFQARSVSSFSNVGYIWHAARFVHRRLTSRFESQYLFGPLTTVRLTKFKIPLLLRLSQSMKSLEDLVIVLHLR